MTTIAFDGKTMACDTKAVDQWGLIETELDKIYTGIDFIAGGAGRSDQIITWWKSVKNLPLREVIELGYKAYDEDKNSPNIMLVSRIDFKIYRKACAEFVEIHRPFFAVGSGRDYALAAMHLGKTAAEAVSLAMVFDNGTGGNVVTVELDGGFGMNNDWLEKELKIFIEWDTDDRSQAAKIFYKHVNDKLVAMLHEALPHVNFAAQSRKQGYFHAADLVERIKEVIRHD